jgi:hypothetical protein
MEGHDHHQSMPGYSPDQLLHRGCGECDIRSRERAGGLDHLDPARFEQAWRRAAQWNLADGGLPDLDPAEIPMLRTLWAVQRQLEKRGIPLGMLPFIPSGDTTILTWVEGRDL